jgi:hypothetical protein
MAEYTSPYKVEGFENVAMSKIFTDLLMIQPQEKRVYKGSSGRPKTTSSSNPTCPPDNAGPNTLTAGAAATNRPEPTSFLKTMLIQERNTVDSLMETAKKISPVAKRINQMEDAYDAAFESDIRAPLPGTSKTLQGFAVLLFFISYIALAIIGTIAINSITKSGRAAAGAFVGFVIVGFILLTLIAHLG